MNMIYLDYNATTPIHPEVVEAMIPYLREHFGNPSSSHRYGTRTRLAVEEARSQVAAMLGCQTDEVIFTSGGSESNNLAIKGYVLAHRDQGNHIITLQVEHPAVLEVCRYLETVGFAVTYLPVDEQGLVSRDEVERAITQATTLITIMQANNEVGTIEPIAEIAGLARERGIAVHTDSAQAVGKIAVDIESLGVDMISIAGHKFYAPKGVGALYVRRGIKLHKLMHGADHERDQRAGTENVAEIIGLGKACELVTRERQHTFEHTRKLRDRLEQVLTEKLPSCRVNGHREKRLPNTLSVSFPGIEAETIMAELDQVACSAGAACHSDAVTMSHVLVAMKVPVEYAMGTIRFSTGSMTTDEEIDRAAAMIVSTINRLSLASDAETAPVTDDEEIRLTKYTHGLGCACKLRPQALERVLAKLPVISDKQVLVGTSSADDAAVYKISDDLAIVQTVDFFTPIVDDPYHFGAIAAANSLSDIYAMGATPLFALSVVGFPSNRLPLTVLEEILRGANDKAAEAGISIIGGHTVDDTEPKYGLAVTGKVDPAKVFTNDKARIGDKLILTKPIGLGIISTAIKRQLADQALVEKVIAIMSALNQAAAAVMVRYDVSACTDVTGFGLLGHLSEMTTGSGVDAVIYADKVPLIEKALSFVEAGIVPGGTENNLEYVADRVNWPESISPTKRVLLCDAQTSGGLLIAVSPTDAEKLLSALHREGVGEATIIGEITAQGKGNIRVE
ncbi:MAG: selenide, water dikinase SelD [candidate division Zixibacteria bacterium]|nr:selenide, water dikinase SelD [candidate division Zixibacteria bacterium]